MTNVLSSSFIIIKQNKTNKLKSNSILIDDIHSRHILPKWRNSLEIQPQKKHKPTHNQTVTTKNTYPLLYSKNKTKQKTLMTPILYCKMIAEYTHTKKTTTKDVFFVLHIIFLCQKRSCFFLLVTSNERMSFACSHKYAYW